MSEIIGSFPSLKWALEKNEKLTEILMGAFSNNEKYLSSLDELFEELRKMRYQGTREKIKDASNIDKFRSQISEFRVGVMFGKKGKSVRFLPDSFMDARSPDILVVQGNGRIYVEVTRVTDDESDAVILNFLRRFLKDKPFMVNIKKKSSLALPVMKWQERTKKIKLVKKTLEEFQEKFRAEFRQSGFRALPKEIDTVGAVFEVLSSNLEYGFPGMMTTDVAKIPEEDYAEMITYKMIEKARKRDDWRGEDRKTLYIIAIHLEHPFYSVPFDDLLLGERTEIVAVDESQERLREIDWVRIVSNPKAIIPNWEEIETASEKGWKGYLIDKSVIPSNYMYITKPGIFLEESSMSNVSGVLVFGPSGFFSFIPNPFADDEINDPDLTQLTRYHNSFFC